MAHPRPARSRLNFGTLERSKGIEQPARFVRPLLKKDFQRPHRSIVIRETHQASGSAPILCPFISRTDAAPDYILPQIPHVNAEFIRAIHPAQAPMNMFLETLASGLLQSEQSHRCHAVLMNSI